MRIFSSRVLPLAALTSALLSAPSLAAAQSRPSLEATAGWAGFVDEATIHHSVFGAGLRVPITRRLAVTPEVVYMVGPESDRDLMVTGDVVFDLASSARVQPYVVGGLGAFRHREKFGGLTFSSTEPAFTAGGGIRVWLTPSLYLAPEFRLGWELHARASVALGFRL